MSACSRLCGATSLEPASASRLEAVVVIRVRASSGFSSGGALSESSSASGTPARLPGV